MRTVNLSIIRKICYLPITYQGMYSHSGYSYTVEPLLKAILNKGHACIIHLINLSIKDKFCGLYKNHGFTSKEDNLSITTGLKVSLFGIVYLLPLELLAMHVPHAFACEVLLGFSWQMMHVGFSYT